MHTLMTSEQPDQTDLCIHWWRQNSLTKQIYAYTDDVRTAWPNRSMHTLMTSEQPDQTDLCIHWWRQNSLTNTRTVKMKITKTSFFFSKIQNVSGLNFLTLFGYNFSCKEKLAFFKIVPSEKAKFKNQKMWKLINLATVQKFSPHFF